MQLCRIRTIWRMHDLYCSAPDSRRIRPGSAAGPRVREQLASRSWIRTGDSAPGKILLEAYILNLDPSGVAGSSEQIRFSKGMAGRLYIKGTLYGQPALRYTENLQLSRGDAEQSLARAVDSGVANLSQILRRLQGITPEVAAPSN